LTGDRHGAFLSVGDITFRVVSDDRRLASAPDASLEQFFTAHGRADVDVRAGWTDTPADCGGELVFDSGGSWQLFRSGGELLFTFRSSGGGPAPYKTARFNPDFTAGDVRLHRRHFEHHMSDAVYALQYPLDELLMIHLLSRGKGVEIHGCALLDRAGRAYVFAGQSGAGKSTLARLWIGHDGVTLLSDERVVLRTDRDRITAYGTPWHGDALLASPRCGELAAVFFLHHGPSHTVAPTGGALAAAKLFACAFLPFHDAGAVDRTMAAVEQVTRDARCYDLWFAPDRSIIDVLAAHMG
jgi:predicted ATPase